MAIDEDKRLTEWRNAPEMIDLFNCSKSEISDFVRNLDAEDLHIFTRIHGIEVERALFKTLLSHPKLDRATALELFHACNPAFYENELKKGVPFERLAHDREDEIFLEILELAYSRLTKGPEMSSRFMAPCLVEWVRFPQVSPADFKRWPLSDAVLMPTAGQKPKSSLFYDHSKVRLSFELWVGRT